MKYLFTFFVFVASFSAVNAQEQTAKLLQETARTLVQKGDYDNAIVILERAKQQEPNNIEILKDLCFASYLKRDFGKSIEIGKELVEKPNADEQSFQMLGLSYKATANNKECAKLYRTALRKFPNSGVIYNEYAELLASDNELDEAITQWEKGIEVDPVHSSNYYNATMFYAQKNNWIRAALYGEIFLNLESYSKRTEDIKAQLLAVYNNLLAPASLQQLKDAKATSVFEKNILEVLAKHNGSAKGNSNIEDLISVRTKFIVEWMQAKQKTYPFQLFDHQQYLLSQGLFEAYNYWLFSTEANSSRYLAWQ
ncbi:MAG: tetratricopeptide repeat protein, partial [Sediminibacterium sp.]